MMPIERDFLQYLNQFYQNKFNQISNSNQTQISRMRKLTFDLSEDLQGQFKKFQIPMRGLHVEKFYTTTTDNVSGTLKMCLDYNDISSERQFKTLRGNDSYLDTSGSTSQFFISWDLQPGVFCDVVFFVDIDYRPGSTATSIIGTVNVVTGAELYQTDGFQEIDQGIGIGWSQHQITGADKFLFKVYEGIMFLGDGFFNVALAPYDSLGTYQLGVGSPMKMISPGEEYTTQTRESTPGSGATIWLPFTGILPFPNSKLRFSVQRIFP